MKGLIVAAVMDIVTGTEAGEMRLGGVDITDDELTALALAADPDEPLGADAVPFAAFPSQFVGALPLWYMAPVTARAVRSWRMPVALMIVAAFLLVDAFGLCITYGQLTAA